MGRFAVDGPAVVVPARVAHLLRAQFNLAGFREEAYRRGDRVAYEVLVDLHAVALQWLDTTTAAASDGGSPIDPGPEVGPSSEAKVLGSSEVARAAGVTPRAVVMAANAGRLRGQQVAGRWWFYPADVARWMATRAA